MTLGGYPILSLADARHGRGRRWRASGRGARPGRGSPGEGPKPDEGPRQDRALVAQFDKRHLSAAEKRETVRRELDRHVVADGATATCTRSPSAT
jgi:hypothetical protein